MNKRKLPIGGVQTFSELRRDYIYVLEFKTDKPVEGALWQIEEKDYAAIYTDSGKKLIKIGVVFSRELRNIIEWRAA